MEAAGRYPVDSDRRASLKAVFSEALELPEDERASFVARALDNTADRAEVERLLGWYAAEFLSAPAIEEPPREAPGNHIGNYLPVRELGRGGMGTVYLAQREDELAGRQVALKAIAVEHGVHDLQDRFTR